MKTAFFKEVITAMKAAGCKLVRRNNGHEIFRTPQNIMITVPRKLDDPRLAYRIVKRAGARL